MRSPRSEPARRTVHSIDCIQCCVDFPVSSFILMSEMSLSYRRRKVAGAGLDGRARHRLDRLPPRLLYPISAPEQAGFSVKGSSWGFAMIHGSAMGDGQGHPHPVDAQRATTGALFALPCASPPPSGRPASQRAAAHPYVAGRFGRTAGRPRCDWERRASNLLVPALRSSASLEFGARASAQTGAVVGT